MVLFNVILSSILLTALGFTLWGLVRVRRERKMNAVIVTGLDTLMATTREEIAKNKKLVEKTRTIMEDMPALPADEQDTDPMHDPDMLSTVISAIVKRLGTIKLGLKDFEAVSGDDYVSVYVDTVTQDLILSLNHELAGTDPKDPMSMINLGNSDDSTFH